MGREAFSKFRLGCAQNSLETSALKYIGPKISSNIPDIIKLFSPYSFAKQYENVLSSQNSCRFSFYMLVTFC